jgi:hypothetical protein
MKKSKINYEHYLNRYYAGLDINSLTEQLFYLTDQERYRFCSVADIKDAMQKQTVGLLIRRFDSKLFDKQYEEWLRE